MMTDAIERVADAIRAFERGEMVVVTDDNDRENEGDLFIAAEHCTAEKMAFMIRHTSGIICAPLTQADASRLRLDPMVASNDAPLATAFTVSVDFRHDLTTGISAEERTATVRALANDNTGPADFVRPGHVFPLIARDGGVLMRSGHTEACIDLCRLAGLAPIGALSELVNDDGTVKRGQQVSDFAREHNLPAVSVADIIAYRQRSERLVERVDSFPIETIAGPATAHTYRTPFDPMQHLAIVFGDIRDGRDLTVRLQLEDVTADVFGPKESLERIVASVGAGGRGVLVYLREGSVGVTHTASRTRDLVDGTDDALAAAGDEAHDSAQDRETEWREIGLGAQILVDLGVRSIRLLASRERRYVGLGGFGIEIETTEILDG